MVSSQYEKEKFENERTLVGSREAYLHNAAAISCFFHADRWLAEFAPSELGVICHEDGTPAKAEIKKTLRTLRSREFAEWAEKDGRKELGVTLPLKRIIDTANFMEKPEARPLQLADLCAFIIGRHMKGKDVPEDVFRIIQRHRSWMPYLEEKANPSSRGGAS